jgi:hypothetical protein
MGNIIIDISMLCELLQPESGTFSQLKAKADASELQVGKQYELTDYEARYFDPATGNYVVSGIEPLLLTAVSTSSFNIIAKSTLHPTDLIEYDFSINTVTDGVTTEICKGVITSRKDKNQNECGYDFRNITFGGNLTFQGAHFGNTIDWNDALPTLFGVNLPSSEFKGDTINNRIITALSNFDSNTVLNDNCIVLFSDVQSVFIQNSNCEIINSTILGVCESNSRLVLNNATVRGDFAFTNNCTIIDTNDLRLFSCNNFIIENCIVTNVENFVKCGSCNGYNAGLIYCEIIGLSPTSFFGFNSFETDIHGTISVPIVIDEATHPLLFSYIPCKITRRLDNTYGYTYLNNSGATIFVTL